MIDEVKLRAKMAAAVSPVNATAAVTCIYLICYAAHIELDRHSLLYSGTMVGYSHSWQFDGNELGSCISIFSNCYAVHDTYCLVAHPNEIGMA